MNREERAKQFLPFDALKGLREELKKREAAALRRDRRQLSDEEAEKISRHLLQLKRGQTAEVVFYDSSWYRNRRGEVLSVNTVTAMLTLSVEGEKLSIAFEDLYRLRRY